MSEESINELEMKNEELAQKISIEEKKALIKEAQHRYGKDWSKFFSGSSGIDWQSLKFRMQ